MIEFPNEEVIERLLSLFIEKLQAPEDDKDSIRSSLIAGINYLQEDIAGITLDFGINQNYNSNTSLLFDYVRYSYNNALEFFEENFKKQLTRLQIKSMVKSNANG